MPPNQESLDTVFGQEHGIVVHAHGYDHCAGNKIRKENDVQQEQFGKLHFLFYFYLRRGVK